MAYGIILVGTALLIGGLFALHYALFLGLVLVMPKALALVLCGLTAAGLGLGCIHLAGAYAGRC